MRQNAFVYFLIQFLFLLSLHQKPALALPPCAEAITKLQLSPAILAEIDKVRSSLFERAVDMSPALQDWLADRYANANLTTAEMKFDKSAPEGQQVSEIGITSVLDPLILPALARVQFQDYPDARSFAAVNREEVARWSFILDARLRVYGSPAGSDVPVQLRIPRDNEAAQKIDAYLNAVLLAYAEALQKEYGTATIIPSDDSRQFLLWPLLRKIKKVAVRSGFKLDGSPNFRQVDVFDAENDLAAKTFGKPKTPRRSYYERRFFADEEAPTIDRSKTSEAGGGGLDQMVDPSALTQRVAKIAEESLTIQRKGQRPKPNDVADFFARHLQIMKDLFEFLSQSDENKTQAIGLAKLLILPKPLTDLLLGKNAGQIQATRDGNPQLNEFYDQWLQSHRELAALAKTTAK
jgi:hypothetical protein